MINYIYKITLTKGNLEGHYYIGKRTYRGTDPLKDKYKGSGVIVKKYYKQYPDDYKKEILEICDSIESLNIAEAKWVGDKFDTDPMCLNLCAGGQGGSDGRWMQGKKLSEETKRKISNASKGRKFSEQTKKHLSEIRKGVPKTVKRTLGNAPTAKKVLQFDLNGNLIKEWSCGTEASLAYGKNKCAVGQAIRSGTKCAGYIWKYK